MNYISEFDIIYSNTNSYILMICLFYTAQAYRLPLTFLWIGIRIC